MANSILKPPIGLLRPFRVAAIWAELLSWEASDKGNDRQSDTESTCSVSFHNNARSTFGYTLSPGVYTSHDLFTFRFLTDACFKTDMLASKCSRTHHKSSDSLSALCALLVHTHHPHEPPPEDLRIIGGILSVCHFYTISGRTA
jgi:hypothetical protein